MIPKEKYLEELTRTSIATPAFPVRFIAREEVTIIPVKRNKSIHRGDDNPARPKENGQWRMLYAQFLGSRMAQDKSYSHRLDLLLQKVLQKV
jgi:hypothetical protein